MNGLTTKVSLYDLLSMIIPGYLFLYLLKRAFFSEYSQTCDESTYLIVVFSCSYIIGLAIHYIAKLIFKSLRNNKCIITRTREKFYNLNNVSIESKKDILSEYMDSYYIASKYNWSSIPVLEAQYSFLRSMILVELAYLLLGCKASLSICQMSIIALVLIITLILMIKILYDTSYRVWEDSFFCKRLNADE